MKKKKIKSTLSAVALSVALMFTGITAITTYADESNNVATGTPGAGTVATETPETPGTGTPGTIKPSIIVESSLVKKDGVTEISKVPAGIDVVITLEAIEAAGTGSFNLQIGEVKLEIPAAILALGVGDVSVESTVLEVPKALKDSKVVDMLFDLKLKDSAGNYISDFKGNKITATLELEDSDFKGLDKSKLKVFYWNNGKVEQWFDTKIDGNKVTFTTGHFSTFGIGEYSKSSSNGIKTGDTNNVMALVATLVGSVVLASVVGGVYVVKKRKESVNK